MRFKLWPLLLFCTTVLLAGACTSPSTPEADQATATLTPTVVSEPSPTETSVVVAEPEEAEPTATSTPTKTPASGAAPSACADLSGELEAQVLVGPAEAVGLEPAAVGSIPFTVTPDQDTYVVQGQNTLSYEDTLQQEWGTYSVSLDMDITIDGVCREEEGTPVLDLTLTSSGEQLVEVTVGGSQHSYPWSGENTLHMTLPVEEGASAEGEGWLFVLHPD
ncbi:MAG: hypothetical protein U9R72_02260 [Chloroflexota bacterium]|nr:hypothetical protein [Chloroflexota bacterium]